MRIIEFSKNGPLVVFIHGFPNDHRVWNSQVGALKERFHVAAVDFVDAHQEGRGSGLSAHRNFDYLVSNLRLALSEIRSAKASSAIYIIGHDMGCFFAEALAQDASLAVDGLMLINGKGLDHYFKELGHPRQILKSFYVLLLQLPFVPYVLGGRLRRFFERVAYRLAGVESADCGVLEQLSSFKLIYLYRTLFRAAIKSAANGFVGQGDLEKNQVPTAVVQSTRDPFLYATPETELKKYYGNSLSVYTTTVGHWGPVTDAVTINRIITKQLGNWESAS